LKTAILLLEAIYRVVPMDDKASKAAVSSDPSAPADDTVEMAALIEAFNNDEAFLKDIADIFLSDYPPMLETLGKAIADEDGVLLSRTAHSLKGMARNFQVDAASDVARQLELLAEQEQFAAARPLCRKLADELAGFERRLRRMLVRISEA
jgi:HPt (histidine-containing phosphotransfer) domain-containing protein